MQSKSFKELNVEERKVKIEELLENLKRSKHIKNYYSESNSYIIYLEYKYGESSLIMLEDFDLTCK